MFILKTFMNTITTFIHYKVQDTQERVLNYVLQMYFSCPVHYSLHMEGVTKENP